MFYHHSNVYFVKLSMIKYLPILIIKMKSEKSFKWKFNEPREAETRKPGTN